MTRAELLDHLRRELTSENWSELRPDDRLAALETRVDELVEKLQRIRTSYDDTSGRDLLRALDELAAALSYFRSDLGHAFSETTRLTNELREALRRLERDTPDAQMRIGLSDDDADTGGADTTPSCEAPTQTSLFGE